MSTETIKRRGPAADAWIHITPERIMEFRQKHELSEAAVAAVFGVSVGSIRNWTKGGQIASLKKQQKVAQAIQGYTGAAPAAKARVQARGKAQANGQARKIDPRAAACYMLECAKGAQDPKPFIESALQALNTL